MEDTTYIDLRIEALRAQAYEHFGAALGELRQEIARMDADLKTKASTWTVIASQAASMATLLTLLMAYVTWGGQQFTVGYEHGSATAAILEQYRIQGEARMDRTDARLDQTNERLDQTNARLDKLSEQVGNLENLILEVRANQRRTLPPSQR